LCTIIEIPVRDNMNLAQSVIGYNKIGNSTRDRSLVVCREIRVSIIIPLIDRLRCLIRIGR
jgi:hypothetical protein